MESWGVVVNIADDGSDAPGCNYAEGTVGGLWGLPSWESWDVFSLNL